MLFLFNSIWYWLFDLKGVKEGKINNEKNIFDSWNNVGN